MSSRRRWCWRELYWPRPLKWTVVQQLMHRLVADPGLGPLVIETRATNETIRFQIAADVRCVRVVESLLSELVPGMQTVTAGVRRAVTRAARLKVTHPLLALDTSRIEAVTRALLAGLSGLRTGEQLVLQLFIGGRVAPMLSRRPPLEARQSWWSLLNHGAQAASGDELARVRERRRQHGALVSVRLGAEAATPQKARALIQRLFGALCTIEAAGVRLRLWPEDPAKLNQIRRPWGYGMQLSSTEIASLTGWPVGEEDLPGLPPVSPRQIPPPNWLAGMRQRLAGRIFAHSSAPGRPVALGIPPRDALLHTVLLGPTGAGKSTALEHLALADITAGRGVVVIDPKSDLVTELLERIPAERVDDVVVLDPTDPSPVGLNPLAAATRQPELTVDAHLATCKAVFADSWGIRTEEILTAALLTLATVGGPAATLVMIPSLLTNPAFRRMVTRQLHDPLGASAFWAKFDAKSPEQQATEIAPVLNKLQQFVIRPQMRAVLGQTQPRFQLREVFTNRTILLVSLNKGVIGSEAARLLGSLLIGQLWPLILSRAALPPERRHLVSIYVDEVHDFLHGIPGDLADALAQSRSLGVAWHLAHQYRSQLTPAMRAAIDANARNKICFGLAAPDARDMAAMASGLEPLDFIRLPRYATYSTAWVDGKETGWISGITLPPHPSRRPAIDARAASRHRYGVPAEETETALTQLTSQPTPTAPATETTSPPAPMASPGEFGRRPTPTKRRQK